MQRHVPVLAKEVLDLLNLQPNQNVIDCTLGDAGHSELMLEKTGPNGKLLGIDADPESVLRAKQYLYRFGNRVIFIRDNFENIKESAESVKFGPVHAILFDLGWSTPQFAERGRGFSFENDEPLDMRFSGEHQGVQTKTAAEILNEYSKDELTKIFKYYGEEKFAEVIAEEIVNFRKNSPLKKTGELTELVLKVYREKLHSDKEVPWVGGTHPATQVFQALRIETNNELDVLKKVLPKAVEALVPGGRLAVITFHSLEDRIVKHYFQSNNGVKIITKKPVVPSDAEVNDNHRSRSAKLRVVEKI